jgi:hypothetical protein
MKHTLIAAAGATVGVVLTILGAAVVVLVMLALQ